MRKDEELRAEIQQDVDRCMPENLYFRQPETQRMLLDVLFVFCKLNPDVGYRQGMHELLAPILFVVERDAIELGPSSKALGEDATVGAVFDADHIEHDTFALFSQTMQSAKNFYEQTTHNAKENPIVLRSRRIFNELLLQLDPALAQHLERIEIVPQVFLMRWIRLLFGREFSFDDTLTMWDVIFSEDPSLALVDHICLAMLLRIRWELLEADYNTAMTLLLRYPEPNKDHPPQTFVLDALYLRDHMTTDGSGYLVLKYTGRPLHPANRPATPPALQRNITAFSGTSIARAVAAGSALSPPRVRNQRSNIESIMQSTAKNIYTRGEKLGIGRAVRSAVDEVHKRAQEIRETQTPSLPPRPRGQHSGSGPLQSRVVSLEARNRQLSKLLEGAVGELWDYQRLVVEREERPEKGAKPDVEQLSVAIAKVQFIQVYLDDLSLPLQETDPRPDLADQEATVGDQAASGPGQAQVQASTTVVSPSLESDARIGELADPSTFEEADSSQPSPTIEQAASRSHSASGTKTGDTRSVQGTPPTEDVHAASVNPTDPPGLQAPRPALATSSYSWMLGQTGSEAEPFSRTSTVSPEQSRHQASLFGEGNGDYAGTKKKRSGGRERKQKAAAAEAHEGDAFDLGTL